MPPEAPRSATFALAFYKVDRAFTDLTHLRSTFLSLQPKWRKISLSGETHDFPKHAACSSQVPVNLAAALTCANTRERAKIVAVGMST